MKVNGGLIVILGVLLVWCVFDAPNLFRPVDVVRPIVRPVIDEIRDRIVDPVSRKEVSGPTVIVIGRSWCAPCKKLMAEEMPKAKADGYAVIYDDKSLARVFPTVRIWDGKKWKQRSGFFEWVKP